MAEIGLDSNGRPAPFRCVFLTKLDCIQPAAIRGQSGGGRGDISLAPCLKCYYKQKWHQERNRRSRLTPSQYGILVYLHTICPHKRDGKTHYSCWLANSSFASTFGVHGEDSRRAVQNDIRELIEHGLIRADARDGEGVPRPLIPLSGAWNRGVPADRIALTPAGIRFASALPNRTGGGFEPESRKRELDKRRQAMMVFLRALFGRAPGHAGNLVFWAPGLNKMTDAPFAELERTAAALMETAERCDLLVSASLHNPLKAPRSVRASALPGVWLDVGLPEHERTREQIEVFPGEAAAWAESLPLPPTLAVSHGEGAQFYWLLEQIWYLDSSGESARARAFLGRFQNHLRPLAQERGWICGDLSTTGSFMRLPGTFAHTRLRVEDVVLLRYHKGRRYHLHELQAFLDREAPAVRKSFLGGVIEDLKHLIHMMNHANRSAPSAEDRSFVLVSGDGGGPDGANGPAGRASGREAADYYRDFDGNAPAVLADAPPVDDILALAADVELFHTPGRVPHAAIPHRGYVDCHPIRSETFRSFLAHRYFEAHRRSPGMESVELAIGILTERERETGAEEPVYVRVGRRGGNLYLDLANDEGETVEIAPDGWRVRKTPGARFQRKPGMRSLPRPTGEGGGLDALAPLINVDCGEDLMLAAGWLIESLRPDASKPILYLYGDRGAAKSTACRILACAIDPKAAPLQCPPAGEAEFFAILRQGWTAAFDAVSAMPPWWPSALCRASSGAAWGGVPGGDEYAGPAETGSRPVILNGSHIKFKTPELAERLIPVFLRDIPAKHRREEQAVWNDFIQLHPSLLGALLDGASAALRGGGETALPQKPRMADFVQWVSAAEKGMGWKPGSFAGVYLHALPEIREQVPESDGLTEILHALVEETPQWEGSAQELLEWIHHLPKDNGFSDLEIPDSPRSLTNRLRKMELLLAAQGIEITFADNSTWDSKEKRTKRVMTIQKTPAPQSPGASTV